MRSVTTRKFFCWGCYSRHNSGAGCNFGCWNRRHSFLHTVLLSAAQFGSGFWGLGIVIERTVCEKCCCYLQHSLPGQAAGFLQNLLLSSAQFGKIHGLFRVVIGGTFLLPGQSQGCYVRHISKNSAGFSPVVICSTFSGWGLLFSAQFTVCIISFLQRRVLLFAAHFAKNHCLACPPCCYSRHNSRKNFCCGCYSAHNSAKILLLPGRLLVSTQFQEFSLGVVIHSTI